MSSNSAGAARRTLPAPRDRAEASDELEITRRGRVVAVLVRTDALWRRRTSAVQRRADDIRAMIDRARTEPLRPPSLCADEADELLAAIRSSRSER